MTPEDESRYEETNRKKEETMTDEEAFEKWWLGVREGSWTKELYKAAFLAGVAHERKACAELAERLITFTEVHESEDCDWCRALEQCAESIRARGNK